MPFDRRKYPANWEDVSQEIRFVRAGGRCECEGECGLHRTNPGPRRCVEINGEDSRYQRGKVVLTVAHLNAPGGICQCEPRCADPSHLKAMCQRCHLRYDHPRHVANARKTRHARKAHRDLFDEGEP